MQQLKIKTIGCIFLIIAIVFGTVYADPLPKKEFYPLSQQELINLSNKMKNLQEADSLKTEIIKGYKSQVISLKQVIIIDSLQLKFKDKEIKLYKDKLDNSRNLSWWENVDQYAFFFLGVAVIIGGAYVVKDVRRETE